MRKNGITKRNQSEHLPITRHSRQASYPNLYNPWFDSFLEPSGWLDIDNNFFPRGLSPFQGDNRFLAPAIDIDENDEEYIVSADMPGIKKEDISIECSGNQLTISAERKYESTDGNRNDRRERYYGSYQRSFTLPSGVDVDKIEATCDGGVLTVRIPKEEGSKARRIPIGEAKQQSKSS
jgi:HSP20 family protein